MRRLSLRTRLVLGLVVLAAAGLVVADVATYKSQESFLFQQTDDNLQNEHQFAEQGRGPNGPGGPGLPPGVYIEGRSIADGRLLFQSQGAFPRRGGGLAAAAAEDDPISTRLRRVSPIGVRYFTANASSGDDRYRVRASIERGNPGVLLIVASSLHDVDATLHRLFLIELFVTLAVLAALVLLALWVVRIGLRPLREIEQTAAAIGAGDLSRRVDRAEPSTEIGRLGLALNAMLGQIETAFRAREASEARLRRFVADASHELRTPLAAVRAYAELFRRGAASRPDDLERAMGGIGRESERMSLLVDDLLLLARLDEGRPLEREPVRSRGGRRRSGRDGPDGRSVAADRARRVACRRAGRPRPASSGRRQPARERPLPHARRQPRARPRRPQRHERRARGRGLWPGAERRGARAGLRALPPRRSFAHARRAGGVGLGLSIVAAVAEAHGGSASARSTPGKGTTFVVTLPLLEAGQA